MEYTIEMCRAPYVVALVMCLGWSDSVHQKAIVKVVIIAAGRFAVIIKRGASDEAEHHGVP